VNNNQRPIINHHFGHVHVNFYPGLEQCCNRRQNLISDETRTELRGSWASSRSEISWVDLWRGFWHVCHRPKTDETMWRVNDSEMT